MGVIVGVCVADGVSEGLVVWLAVIEDVIECDALLEGVSEGDVDSLGDTVDVIDAEGVIEGVIDGLIVILEVKLGDGLGDAEGW